MWNVRESYQSLIADSLDTEIPIQSLRDRRDGLQAALHKLYLAAPFTDDKAYAKAKSALKDNEDLMFYNEGLAGCWFVPAVAIDGSAPARTYTVAAPPVLLNGR
jgi:SMODS and SLOG-associating 2TM effector domain family 4